ncbi:MAG: hypothetical protein LBS33_04795 [Streptococcaceae bacterium]|jgi:hypothetical protein|nr:hypothetical protein [Streptococcaceae bacterium]
MEDKYRQRALLEENYYDDKRKLNHQKEVIFEKENEFKRGRSRLMDRVYSVMPKNTQELRMLDNRLHNLNDEFLTETKKAHRKLEDEQRELNSSFNLALDNLK